MPKAKTNRGQHKTISCPRCGKKFTTETNVLQHMNQPMGSCYGTQWHEEMAQIAGLGFEGSHLRDSPPSSSNTSTTTEIAFEQSDNATSGLDFPPLARGLPDAPDVYGNPPGFGGPHQGFCERFVESYEGCSETFPGGKTFMDTFKEDQFAADRQHNPYYPFASGDEWEFASWLLRSGLSLAAIDSLMSLKLLKQIPLSFRTGKQLRSRAEMLPSGPRWLGTSMTPQHPTKRPVRLFYRDSIECLQALLSHPLFESHISFVPQRVWTSAAKICRIYDQWLSGDRAWSIQNSLPRGSTVLGVVLSSDKTNISVMSGNRMAHPLLISLANIDAAVRSKTSLHAYLLLALLPIAKFIHKESRVRSLLQDRLVHQALDIVLSPLKIAASVGIMMSDPVGNLRYCFTPLASWIADTPEESLLSATSSKVSPVTTATSKQFGDSFRHPPRTGQSTLASIRTVCAQDDISDFKPFLKAIRALGLNGVLEPFWKGWPCSDPSDFITPEPLHHFHRMSWDHDAKWCIVAVGAAELDFRFSVLQVAVGYRGFLEGISKLKQVTGRDHRAVQRYIVGVIAGAVPKEFLVAIRALTDFRYLAQAPSFTDESIKKVACALEEFHNHKDAILRAKARTGKNGPISSWEIPKLELLQSVAPSIRQSGAVMQWTADITEHAHVDEIKVPARAGNNQNYYSQISRHLDRLEKCFRFDLATYIESHADVMELGDEDEAVDQDDEEHEPASDDLSLSEYHSPTRIVVNYFAISAALSQGRFPKAPRPHRTFSTTTTAFHIGTKPSLRLTIDEAATMFGLPDLLPELCRFWQRIDNGVAHSLSGAITQDENYSLPFDRLQIWCKLRVQQMQYHEREKPDAPQTLRAVPPTTTDSHGRYDAVIVGTDSDWPQNGLRGHSVGQLRLIFRPLNTQYFAAYVQRFNIVPQHGTTDNIHRGTGMHLLRRAVRSNSSRIGEVIPVTQIRSPAHLIPNFGKEAHPRLTCANSCEVCEEYWLNKYWSKESYFSLSSK